jgi:hypothetical protein
MFGREKPPKYLGSGRQARITTIVVITLVAVAAFFLITLFVAAFTG